MPRVNCPQWGGEMDCERCAFYDIVPASRTEKELRYKCRSALTNGLLDDLVQGLKTVVQSSEQHRDLTNQQIKSALLNAPTQELLTHLGVEVTPTGALRQIPGPPS